MFSGTREIESAELAVRLGVSHRRATDLLRSGALAGRQLPSGAWLTNETAVTRYEASFRRGSGRTLNPESAWGVLWMLDGRPTPWLPRSTRFRLRGQLDEHDGKSLVLAVSGRARAHRFSGRNDSRSSVSITLTGRTVAGGLGVGVRNQPRTVWGYAPAGTIEERARALGLSPAYEGEHTLVENTLPVSFEEPQMPDIVIAVDLAGSTDAREREAGLRFVAHTLNRWRRDRRVTSEPAV